MTKSSESLDSHGVTMNNVHLSDAVEYGDTSTQKGCIFRRIDIIGNPNCRLGTKRAVLGISAIAAYTILSYRQYD